MYSKTVVFMVRWPYFRGAVNFVKNARANSSTAKPVVSPKKLNEIEPKNDNVIETNDPTQNIRVGGGETVRSSLIAAAFAPIKERAAKRPSSVDDSIDSATTPEQLLDLVDTCKLSRKQALKIISVLAEWSVTGEADMKVFERDPRFTSLCQTLGKPYSPAVQRSVKPQTDDLTMVLNVKNDDEASKIITTFNLQQMIKVLSSLAIKKRRSVPLLRSLSLSISQTSTKLDVKQGADVLYALATLNYPEEVLLEKVCAELYECIPNCKKTSVIGSISTSLGLLRYKDIDLLDCLSEWTSKNLDICRNQDLNAVLFTLAHVCHQPVNSEKFFQDVRKRLLESDMSSTRLDVIWALTIFDRSTHEDYSSVLSPQYLERLKATFPEGIPESIKKKLLNINGAAKLTDGYKGPLLETNEELVTLMSRSKEKQVLVTSALEALSNLLPSSVYLRTNVDTKMGFSLDGVCLLDSKMTPLPLVDRKTGKILADSKKGVKIGIMVWDYHEHTKGRVGLCGVPSLCRRLATLSGYRVLSVPYLEFNPKDKLTVRLKYLEKNLRMLVNPS